MKNLNLILTVIYSLLGLYTLYMALLHSWVYLANQKLGHSESIRLPLIYWVSAVSFSSLSIIGYNIIKGNTDSFILKSLLLIPLALVVLYVLWAILLIISSGGKWN